MIKYSEGDIIYSSVRKYSFLILEVRSAEKRISRYRVLCLDNGQYTSYFTADLDANSNLVA